MAGGYGREYSACARSREPPFRKKRGAVAQSPPAQVGAQRHEEDLCVAVPGVPGEDDARGPIFPGDVDAPDTEACLFCESSDGILGSQRRKADGGGNVRHPCSERVRGGRVEVPQRYVRASHDRVAPASSRTATSRTRHAGSELRNVAP